MSPAHIDVDPFDSRPPLPEAYLTSIYRRYAAKVDAMPLNRGWNRVLWKPTRKQAIENDVNSDSDIL